MNGYPYKPEWIGTGRLVRMKDVIEQHRRDPPPPPLTVPWPLEILLAEAQAH